MTVTIVLPGNWASFSKYQHLAGQSKYAGHLWLSHELDYLLFLAAIISAERGIGNLSPLQMSQIPAS